MKSLLIATVDSFNSSSSSSILKHCFRFFSHSKNFQITQHQIEDLADMAHKLRIHSIEMTNIAGSGHPTSCSSIAEILSVLFFDKSGMKYYPTDPKNPANDKLVLSKGHAAPIYYSAWAEAGNFPIEQLKRFRNISSNLEGHPTPRLEFCDVATGSLGQGLGAACGLAYSSKYLDKIQNKVFCILGDGECAEGSIWEAAAFASFYKLDNLIAIIDANRLGQTGETMLGHNVKAYESRFSSFGFHTIAIDGHNVERIIQAFDECNKVKGKPIAIIAQTLKGKYFTEEIENKTSWHGKPIKNKSEEVKRNIIQKMKNKQIKLVPPIMPNFEFKFKAQKGKFKITPNYDSSQQISTREAYGRALRKLGQQDTQDHVVVLDCDVKNSNMSEYFEQLYPAKFINCFIAEQNMVSVALGISKRNKIPFCSTFGAFFTRAFDQIRMGAMSFGNIKFFGSHSGVSIGQDGPSQMGMEDLAMFRSIPKSLILYPSDAVSTEKAVELAANYNGIAYIKGGRNNHPIIYHNHEDFEIGKSKILRTSKLDVISIVSGGAPIFECLQAYEILKKKNIFIRVIDIFSCKPFDEESIKKNVKETNDIALVIEDHYPQGGLGELVSYGLRKEKGAKVYHCAVSEIPRSGTPEDLYKFFKLTAKDICNTVLRILNENNLKIN